MKSPYAFPHKSRAAIVAYLNRQGRGYAGIRYPFAWNVKTYQADFDGDALRAHIPALSPALDTSFTQHLAEADDLFYRFYEDAGRYIDEGAWTSYPGTDQGDWQFGFAGRSGGWLVLEKWRGRKLCGRDYDTDFDDRDAWPWSSLLAFYRGVRCADSDFTPGNAARAVEYMAAAYRQQWEYEKRAEIEDAAQNAANQMAAVRPDLAPCYA